ncbi:MAG: fibronectin type III domain-containing protein, partial [Bacteroidales bacterium]|nr:fibronectin type III domain-containing protein [Bacteroidales bacterium]
MKKTFMFMLMAIVLSLSGFSQEDYVVGNVNATGSTQYAPSTAYYNYSISQSLYLDSDLEEVPVGTITAISYKTTTSSYETTRSWKIYLAEVDNTSITTSTYIPDDEFTEVFEGTVTITVGGWTTVELNEPFIYKGSGNLVIMVSDYTGSYVNNRPYYVSENVTNTCICYYSDNPSYTTPLTSVALASASITNRPIVKLTVNENGDYCVGVRGVTSSNITSTTATISWQEREDSPTFYYQIKKSIEEWPEEDDYETTTGFSIDFSDLDPMTTYNVRVMTDCGDLQSNWRVVNFTTACGEISTMPYSVDFDNMPTGTPPECWTRAYNATYPQVYNGSSWAHTGTHTIYYWDNNMLSLPGIDTEVLDISELTLSLYAVANANDHAIEVGTCTNPMDSTTFTVFANFYPMNGSQATELYQIPFTGWEESMGNYIAIRRTDAGSGNLVMLDDISLDYTPACLIPTISLSNITGHAVTVTWTSNEDQTYNVQYKPSNETEWSEEENTESPFTLTGLDPETNYQVRVSLYCEENSEVYTSEVKSFTTLVACPAPTISFTGITPESTTVSWTGDEESTYTLRYRASGHDEYVEEDIEVSGNTYDITGLYASTTYQVEVQANCGEEDGLSQWGSATFKTACGYLTQESLPYSDNVEGYVNFEIMDCWQRFPDNTYPRIVNNTNFSHSGTGYLFCGSSSAGTIETRDAVLPGYQGDITALQLDFYLRLDHIVGTFQVGVTTDPSNQDAFVPVYTIVPSDLLVNPGDEGTTFYTYFEIPFSGVEIEEAEVYYPVLREINGWGWLVDDVTLEVIPECSRPANVSTTFTSSRSVNISFASTGEEFALYYKTPTDTEYIEADVTFEAGEEENTWNVALEDLLSETTYSYYIQAICGETTPQSSVLSFTTPVTCPIPVVTIEDVTAESATISWTGFAESYNLRYKLQGSTEYIEEDIEVSGENTYTIEDLLSTHNYQVELQANCGDEDGMSGWGVLQFSTIMLPVDIPYSTDFSGDEETGDRGWLLNNSTCQNYWVMGTTSGYTAMYVTNDGTTAG